MILTEYLAKENKYFLPICISFYNPAYFSRVFKEQFGVNFTEYIKKKRISEAARLLMDNDLTVEEIMRRVGYTDKNHFYKCFREIYNETPAAFRKNKKSWFT